MDPITRNGDESNSQKNGCRCVKQQEQLFQKRAALVSMQKKKFCYSLLDAGRLLKMALIRFMSNFEERS